MEENQEKRPTRKHYWIYGIGLLLIFIQYWLLYHKGFISLIINRHWTLEWYLIIVVALPWLVCSAAVIMYYKKASFMKISKREVVLLILWATIYTGPSFHMMYINNQDTKYEYNRWVSQTEHRIDMMDDFLKKHELVRLIRQDVVHLLGAPNKPYDYQTGEQFVYELGREESKAAGPRYQLIIEFNDVGRVSEYEIKKMDY